MAEADSEMNCIQIQTVLQLLVMTQIRIRLNLSESRYFLKDEKLLYKSVFQN